MVGDPAPLSLTPSKGLDKLDRPCKPTGLDGLDRRKSVLAGGGRLDGIRPTSGRNRAQRIISAPASGQDRVAIVHRAPFRPAYPQVRPTVQADWSRRARPAEERAGRRRQARRDPANAGSQSCTAHHFGPRIRPTPGRNRAPRTFPARVPTGSTDSASRLVSTGSTGGATGSTGGATGSTGGEMVSTGSTGGATGSADGEMVSTGSTGGATGSTGGGGKDADPRGVMPRGSACPCRCVGQPALTSPRISRISAGDAAASRRAISSVSMNTAAILPSRARWSSPAPAIPSTNLTGCPFHSIPPG